MYINLCLQQLLTELQTLMDKQIESNTESFAKLPELHKNYSYKFILVASQGIVGEMLKIIVSTD